MQKEVGGMFETVRQTVFSRFKRSIDQTGRSVYAGI